MENRHKDSLREMELRSDEVAEILTRVPNWMISWGSVVFLLLILLLFVCSYFISYPNIIKGEANVTSRISEQRVFARSKGKIAHIYFNENQIVKANRIIAELDNPANTGDVIYLKYMLDSLSYLEHLPTLPIIDFQSLSLGSIQKEFVKFQEAYINIYKFNESYLMNNNENILINNGSYSNRNRRIKGQEKIRKTNYFKEYIKSIDVLKNKIYEWEENFILKSNIDGQLLYVDNWQPNQNVNNGNLIFSILPTESLKYVVKVKVADNIIYKIREGNKVSISIEKYPESEFGKLNGKIINIPAIPDENNFYNIEVSLSNNLTTDYNEVLEFKGDLKGMAYIITEEVSIFERLFLRN
ncbi:HlyD family efflux transporter periplasmic adaptor subunit [Maribacter litoralis]|uniref:HlyD family secretion protein n=1 Tax=Maribacter litoralis TaxID=2059726 RepID=UPI003F5CD24A